MNASDTGYETIFWIPLPQIYVHVADVSHESETLAAYQQDYGYTLRLVK